MFLLLIQIPVNTWHTSSYLIYGSGPLTTSKLSSVTVSAGHIFANGKASYMEEGLLIDKIQFSHKMFTLLLGALHFHFYQFHVS